MDKFYSGVEKIDGEKVDVSENPHDERRPFKCVLDAGLTATSKGNKVFAVMKGATDGGLSIPHSVKRFPGYDDSNKEEANYDAGFHRDRIFGVHVDRYMKEKKDEGSAAYKK
eukprot:TRINITY_DN66821_c0_g1_i1.p1 TRINITY_DN66821_c0_g1~~TRINITY_DN66821_c0_g1_i1.p1  ORF type:complete len:112 (+),score=22.43 TRINITY_DN66821_c0_g1_i1:402-737(+)